MVALVASVVAQIPDRFLQTRHRCWFPPRSTAALNCLMHRIQKPLRRSQRAPRTIQGALRNLRPHHMYSLRATTSLTRRMSRSFGCQGQLQALHFHCQTSMTAMSTFCAGRVRYQSTIAQTAHSTLAQSLAAYSCETAKTAGKFSALWIACTEGAVLDMLSFHRQKQQSDLVCAECMSCAASSDSEMCQMCPFHCTAAQSQS